MTFTLTVSDIEHNPTFFIERPEERPSIPGWSEPGTQNPVLETVGEAVTGYINTGIVVEARDADGDLWLRIESERGGKWVLDDRFEVRDDRLWVKNGAKFDFESSDNPGGVITLVITVGHAGGTNSLERSTTVQLTNVDDPATGSVRVTKADAASSQAWPTLTATATPRTGDADGIASRQVTWFHNGSLERDDQNNPVTGTSITPDKAGLWHAVLTVTDTLGNVVTLTSQLVTVDAPAPAEDPPASVTTVEKSGVPEDVATRFSLFDLTQTVSFDSGHLVEKVEITRLPTKGSLLFKGESIQAGREFNIGEVRFLTYQPGENGHGDNYDNFGFKLKDTQGRFSADFIMQINVVDANDQPTGMSFQNNANSVTIDEGTVASERQLAIIEFADPDTTAAFLNNAVRLKSIDGVDLLSPYTSSRFEIRNGNELWLKANATLDYEHLLPFSATHTGNYAIVLRYVTGEGETPIDDLTFTLNLNNRPEEPVMRVSETSKLEIPGRTTDAFDTEVRISLYDPDSLRGAEQAVTYNLSDGRFELVEYTPVIFDKRARTERPGIKHYKLRAKAGQSFTPGQEIDVVITANDSTGNASLVTTATVTLTVAAAPAQQPQPDTGTSGPLSDDDVTGQTQWTDGRGRENQPDSHNLNKDNYGSEEEAVLIRTLETDDRIMVDLPYVLVRSGLGVISDSTVSGDQRMDVLYSPHDVSLDANVLAVVSEYWSRLEPFWNFGSLIRSDGELQSYFAPRPDGQATLDYIVREQESTKFTGNANQRDVFLFDGTPDTNARQYAFREFEPDYQDRLLFTGPENSTIYWQVKFRSEDQRIHGETHTHELIFYSSPQPTEDHVLAVFEIFATFDYSQRAWSAGPELTSTDKASLFLDLNKPTLVGIPVERKYFFSDGSRVELNEEMEGTQFVTDYFTSIPYNSRATVFASHNEAQSRLGNDYLVKRGNYDKVPVIKGFEDERDKIALEPDHSRTIWWRESDGNIILYNVANPTNGNIAQQIAIIEGFVGTFSHEDFVYTDPDLSVSSDLIVAIDEIA